MPRKPDHTPPREGVVMTLDAYRELYAFHQQLEGIVRTLQPEVLLEIGYQNSLDQQMLRDMFTSLAQQLAPVVEACEWAPGAAGSGEQTGAGRLH